MIEDELEEQLDFRNILSIETIILKNYIVLVVNRKHLNYIISKFLTNVLVLVMDHTTFLNYTLLSFPSLIILSLEL